MAEYVIYTDSGCDIAPELLKKWGIEHQDLTFHFDGEDMEYDNARMDAAEFYAQMRAGKHAKTSAVNLTAFKESFEAHLQAGRDVLYLGFSSGLSNTYNAGALAASELRESYPDRRICTVDTLSASAGQGLLIYLAAQKRDAGASMQELADYIEEIKLHVAHLFTVDDLQYLRRGGRIGTAVALIGSVLHIKPIMHTDNEGHLTKMTQVRGRKAALKDLAARYGALSERAGAEPIFISHGDCMEDAQRLAELLRAQYAANVQLITDVGPVIGAHSGPGTLALFFLAKER